MTMGVRDVVVTVLAGRMSPGLLFTTSYPADKVVSREIPVLDEIQRWRKRHEPVRTKTEWSHASVPAGWICLPDIIPVSTDENAGGTGNVVPGYGFDGNTATGKTAINR